MGKHGTIVIDLYIFNKPYARNSLSYIKYCGYFFALKDEENV